MPASIRLLLTSTPRSGNTWLRRLIAQIYDLRHEAVHRPADIPWDLLGSNFIVQMHWHRTPGLLQLLTEREMKPIVIIRHPLDVLISICHFSNFEPETRQWLDGEAGNEQKLLGMSPVDEAFMEYALSQRAAALLSVSVEWFQTGVPYVRYEDLVQDPASALEPLIRAIGVPRQPIADAILGNSLDKLRLTSENNHYWMGTARNWEKFLAPENARRIYDRHENVFRTLGYGIGELSAVSPDVLEERWRKYAKYQLHQLQD